MNEPGRFGARAGATAVLGVTLLGACASTTPLMPTPSIYTREPVVPLFTDLAAMPQVNPIDLLYVTDRAPRTRSADPLPYTSERSRSMAFGSVSVQIGTDVAWPTLVEESARAERRVSLDLALGATEELGRFPPLPYQVDVTSDGLRRAPAVMDEHERAAAALRDELARRLARSPRKEVVLFVHGYANSFQDAAFSMGELCHFLGREFVCAIFTWPAGGSRGLMAGYNVDRESGEFAVHHLKQAIRLLAQAPGLERLHLLAHSRGTDVLTSALRELGSEAYEAGSSLSGRFKIRNIVLLAPDLDADVAAAKVFGLISDPDLPFAGEPKPRGVFPPLETRITVYVSHRDKALTLSQFLFGSLLRLGRLDPAVLTPEQAVGLERLAFLVDFIEVEGTPGFLGHSYFVSDPDASGDLIALIRYRLRPGEPGRPLEEVRTPFWRIPASR